MMDVDAAQAVLDNSPFGPWWGFQVEAVGKGQAKVSLRQRPELFRPGGVLQGGCAMTLADVTCWIAIMSLFGEDDPSVTQQMTTSFLGPARTDLVCESTIVRPGRLIVYGTAATTDTAGKLVSHHTLTYIRPPERNGV
ncbi:PaaI family thioesterase [Streptomyces sp. H39-S7]|uniref:PaaI family thioesterase n=1 Tax=Streptomyces sp. H39-S7 TaxID=3004357 RepID=UPI0022AF95A8|nr:PaaI family thioesterase [Streptomyces sp. H39-S7]MCZ4123619.1 PaaI family thioesterase [Streptomyces sp. H39-S7]